jgi:hypothetical protein
VDKGWSNEWVVTDQEIGEVSFLIVWKECYKCENGEN